MRVQPQPYVGATYTILDRGTFVNSTHWQYTAHCVGCSSWIDPTTNETTYLVTTGPNTLAFAIALSVVDDPASNTSTFTVHDETGSWAHDFSQGVSTNFDSLLMANLDNQTYALPLPADGSCEYTHLVEDSTPTITLTVTRLRQIR